MKLYLGFLAFSLTYFSVLLGVNSLFADEIDYSGNLFYGKSSTDSSKFIHQYFITQGKFNLEKIQNLLVRFKSEQKEFSKDVSNTVLREEFFEQGKEFDESQKKGEKEAKKNELVKVFKKYLIPMTQEIIKLVKDEANDPLIRIKMWKLIGLYSGLYAPNVHRTLFSSDKDPVGMIRKMMIPYRFYKKTSRPEAINLSRVSMLKNFPSCQDFQNNGTTLSEKEIKCLKSLEFDLSKLDPVGSALWEKPKLSSFDEYKEKIEKYFPSKNKTIFTFQKISFGGAGSPKIKAYYDDQSPRENAKIKTQGKIKIKVGPEVYPDIFLSFMGRMLGFSQDMSVYREKVKIYLNGVKPGKLKAQWVYKYGQGSFVQYGGEFKRDERGEYLLLKDVLLEMNHPEELRVSSFNINTWDYNKRREYRGMLLWLAWVNLLDVKPANFKTIVRKRKDGNFSIHHRFQDVGYGLAPDRFIKKPRDILKSLSTKGLAPNLFSGSITNKDKKGRLSVWWTDFQMQKKMFNYTTFSDLKWMASKINQVGCNDLWQGLLYSGMPEPVAKIYYQRLLQRRNSMNKVFELKAIDACEIPSNKQLQQAYPKMIDGKGKLRRRVFPNKKHLFAFRNSLPITLFNLFRFNFNLTEFEKVYQQNYKQYLIPQLNTPGGVGINFGLRREFETPFKFNISMPNFGVRLERRIRLNNFLELRESESHQYIIQDRIIFDIGILGSALDQTKLAANLQARVFSREFTFAQYSSSLGRAIRTPFKILQYVFNRSSLGRNDLNPYEAFSVRSSVGFDVNVNYNVIQPIPLVFTGVSGNVSWDKGNTFLFTKDKDSNFHFFIHQDGQRLVGAGVSIGELLLGVQDLSLFSVKLQNRWDKYYLSDYIIPPGELRSLNYNNPIKLLSRLKKSSQKNDWENLVIKSKARSRTRKLNLLLLKNWKKQKNKEDVSIALKGSETKSFIRLSHQKKEFLGNDTLFSRRINEVLTINSDFQSALYEREKTTDDFNYVFVHEKFKAKISGAKLKQELKQLDRKFFLNNKDTFVPFAYNINKNYKKIYFSKSTMISQSALDYTKALKKSFLKRVISCHFKHSSRIAYENCKKSEKKLKFRQRGKRVIKNLIKLNNKLEKKLNKDQDLFVYRKLTKIFRLLKIKQLGHKVLFDLFGEKNLISVVEVYGILANLGSSTDESENRARRRKVRVFGELKKNFASLNYLVNEANFGGLLLMGVDEFYRNFFHPFRRGGLPFTSIHEYH